MDSTSIFLIRPADARTGFPFSGIIIVDGRTNDRMVVMRDGHRGASHSGLGLDWPGWTKCSRTRKEPEKNTSRKTSQSKLHKGGRMRAVSAECAISDLST